MDRVEVFDTDGNCIGKLTNASLQVSFDRHATGGGYVSGNYEEIQPLTVGHYRTVTLKDNERTYFQCWMHSKTSVANNPFAVFSFTYTEGAPLPKPQLAGHSH